MKDCVTVPTENKALKPNKRVNYNFGMVMDVDAFRQEQTHFEWKHALGNRLLHGYGTVCGLELLTEVDGTEVKVLIEPGYAITPRGQWLWVETQLCALLDAWVQNNVQDNDLFVAPGRNRVYITLCYEECPTDMVPIAGKACATEDDTRAPSRILETLRAEFSWEQPEQTGADATDAFGQLLNSIVLTSDATEDESERFLDLVGELGKGDAPLLSPMIESPPLTSPATDNEIRLLRTTSCETIRQAMIVWATQVCPRIEATEEECILLGCIDFDVDIGSRVLPATAAKDDCDRPVLVPTQLHQELYCLLSDAQTGVTSHGDLDDLDADDHPQYLTQGRGDLRYSPLGHSHALDELSDVAAAAPADGESLSWNSTSSQWEPQTHDHALDSLSDVNAPAPSVGEVLTFGPVGWQASPATGTVHDHSLTDLADVNAPTPADGQVLTWDGTATEWQAAPAATLEANLTRIVAMSWFHDRQNTMSVVHDNATALGLAIGFGKDDPNDVGRVRADTLSSNVIQLFGEISATGGGFVPVRLVPRAVVPVRILTLAGRRILSTRTTSAPIVSGVLLLFTNGLPPDLAPNPLTVYVRGDFILDETGRRAIDAEFLRGTLPTGDRPANSDGGIQGGTFISWFTRSQDIDSPININTAGITELSRLPGIATSRAADIIAARPFTSLDELATVSGVTRNTVERIRGLITIA